MTISKLEYLIKFTMKSAHSNGKKLVALNKKQLEILKQNEKVFKQSFQTEQSQFLSSPETDYYIVSRQYMTDWLQYCNAQEDERQQLKPMNHDLVDAGGQLRRGLLEAQDFEIVNEKIYDLIKSDKGIEIRRKAVIVNGEKRVPIYLGIVKYMKVTHKDIRGIDNKQKTAKDFTIKMVQFPLQDTIQNLISAIRDNQNSFIKNIRLWKNNTDDVSPEKFFNYIKEKTKFMVTIYRFDGLGRLIENEKSTVADLNLEENDYFIAEFCQEYSSYFFKSPDEAKCESCYKYKKLEFVCGCKAVAYCTQQCMEKDKRFHMKECKFAQEQELKQEIDMVITPSSSLGKVGLTNLGNTCFMNSCLQCLSNTTPLTQYFLNRYFEKEINADNPLGSSGRLARNYAKFIKGMWCSSESTFSPYSLKGAVAKINPIFSGYAQHDSQEFFSFLVDGLHEDLNRVLKKPYVESVDSKNRPDHVVALESWITHTQRNQSIIVDLMTGQYKSKVVCPVCNLESITFDPFTTVSLPIPEEATPGIMKYFIIFANTEQEAIRMTFQYTKADVKQWLQTAAKLLKRPSEDFVFYILTVFENIYEFNATSKTQILHKVESEGKNVFLLELTPQERTIKQRVEIATRLCKKSYHYEKEYDNLWFKRPFFYEKSTTTVLKIYERMVKFLYKIYTYKKLSYEDYFNRLMKERPFTLVLKYKKSIERCYSKVETSFAKEFVLDDDKVKLSDIMDKIDMKDAELDVRFTKESVKMFQFQKLKAFQDSGEKVTKKETHKEETTVTLDQCFTVFEQKEQLEQGNEWYCPRCKEHRLATKQMTIYKAPQILILHLKRFKNKGILRKQKNETNVVFPIVLNMRKYLIDITPISSYIPELKKQNKYIEPVYKAEYSQTEPEPEYELYAVSNHYGGLGGGHYTAYAKNKDKWYQFNDSSVRAVSEDGIAGSGAYMLFYRRKNCFKMK